MVLMMFSLSFVMMRAGAYMNRTAGPGEVPVVPHVSKLWFIETRPMRWRWPRLVAIGVAVSIPVVTVVRNPAIPISIARITVVSESAVTTPASTASQQQSGENY